MLVVYVLNYIMDVTTFSIEMNNFHFYGASGLILLAIINVKPNRKYYFLGLAVFTFLIFIFSAFSFLKRIESYFAMSTFIYMIVAGIIFWYCIVGIKDEFSSV